MLNLCLRNLLSVTLALIFPRRGKQESVFLGPDPYRNDAQLILGQSINKNRGPSTHSWSRAAASQSLIYFCENKLNYPTTAHFLLVWTEILTGSENVGLFHLITLSTSPCWVFFGDFTQSNMQSYTGIAGKNRFRHSWFALIMGYTFEDIDQQQGK